MPLIRKPAISPAPTEARAPLEVLEALRSGNKDERWAAARRAATLSGVEDALATALRMESDAGVREALFTSLARIDSPQSNAVIVAALRSDDARLRAGALDALRSNVHSIRATLPALLSDADVDVRLLSCELARSLPSEEATRILCDVLLRDPEANVCAAAIDVLAEAGRPEALGALAECEARFRNTPFLMFAIGVARERIATSQAIPHD